jgi:hypothetical protein
MSSIFGKYGSIFGKTAWYICKIGYYIWQEHVSVFAMANYTKS